MAFLPLTLTGFAALTVSGAPEARLAAWRVRATAATADLQGRTPAQLIAALAAHPMLGAAQAEVETRASRAAVQRNLDALTARELVREVTGQGRFRVWATRV